MKGVLSAVKNIGRANGEIDILRMSSTGNIRIYSKRPGYDGFQNMISEIRIDGSTRAVMQTAIDSKGNFVQRRPGQKK